VFLATVLHHDVLLNNFLAVRYFLSGVYGRSANPCQSYTNGCLVDYRTFAYMFMVVRGRLFVASLSLHPNYGMSD
jgi:hypothetical protein